MPRFPSLPFLNPHYSHSFLFFFLFSFLPFLSSSLLPSQASHSSSPSSSSSSSLSCHLQPSVAAMEEAGSGLGLSMSVSNSYLIGQASLTTPTVSSPHPTLLKPHPSTAISPRQCGCCVVLDWSRGLTCVCSICDTVCLSTPAPLWFLMGPSLKT